MFPKCDKRRPITFYTLKLSHEYFNTLHYLIILRSFVSQQTARYQTFDIFDIRIFFTKYHESGIQFIIYKRIQRGDERYNYSKDRSEPFGHFARGWIYPCAVLTFSLYDSGLRARPSIHTYVYTHTHAHTHTVRYEGKEGVAKCAHATHFQVGRTIEYLSIRRRWIEITTDRNGRRKDWEDTSGWDWGDTRARAIAKNCRGPWYLNIDDELGRSWGWDSIKILPIFRATADPGDQRSFSQLPSAGKP